MQDLNHGYHNFFRCISNTKYVQLKMIILRIGFQLILSAILLSQLIACDNSAIRPNVVLILVDDMGWSDLGCYGGEIKTPNIDLLADNGTRFINSYNTSKCFPSRAALLTGIYAQESGFGEDFHNPIANAVTIGQVLQQAGYNTYWSGKHHGIQNPYYLGFNRYYGLRDGASNHFNPGLQREGEATPAQKKMRTWCIDSIEVSPYTPPANFYSTDYFTNYGLDYIEEASKEDDPFFLYLSYTAPHDPLMAWPEDIDKYKGVYDSGYHFIRKRRFDKQKELGLVYSKFQLSEFSERRWDALTIEEKNHEARKMEVYAAMIDRLDKNIGRIVSKLKAEGQFDNTLIMIMSDNGASNIVVDLKNDNDSSEVGVVDRWVSLGPSWANVSNTPFRYFKNYSYEGGIRTPFIVHWPEKIPGAINSDAIVHFIDIMPTLVELSGGLYPKSFDDQDIKPMRGESLVNVFAGQPQTREKPLFFEWLDGQALRNDEWKIVRQGKNSNWELYRIQEDPVEIKNVADEHPHVLKGLVNEFEQWKGSLN